MEYISELEKDELITAVKNNETIKNTTNNGYYESLWETLKKDKDYDNVYTCKMNNSELECYIKEDFIIGKEKSIETEDVATILNVFSKMKPNLEKLERVLKKFGFDVRPDTEVPILQIPAGRLFVYQGNLWLSGYESVAKNTYYGKIRCDLYKVYLTDINLLKPNNIPVIMDKDDENDNWIEIFRDENNVISESNFNYCNEWNCYKIVEREKIYCNYYESENYGDWMQSDEKLLGTYQKCDLGYINCRYISENEYLGKE